MSWASSGAGFVTAMKTLDIARLSLAKQAASALQSELLNLSMDFRKKEKTVWQTDCRVSGSPVDAVRNCSRDICNGEHDIPLHGCATAI